MLYLLLISKKGWYIVHSIHRDKSIAEEWVKCKEHDGEDVILAAMNLTNAEEVANLIISNILSSK